MPVKNYPFKQENIVVPVLRWSGDEKDLPEMRDFILSNDPKYDKFVIEGNLPLMTSKGTLTNFIQKGQYVAFIDKLLYHLSKEEFEKLFDVSEE